MKHFFKKFLITFISLFFFSTNVFAADMASLENMRKIALVGDSYAGFFTYSYPDSFDLYSFSASGIDKGNNKAILLDVANNSSYDYVIFATGVNDHFRQTSIETFESILDEFAKAITLNNKYLIIHTYMNYPAASTVPGLITINDYDKVLRKIANKYFNVLYIDMNEYNNKKYCLDDQMHYNEKFYNSFYGKIRDFINLSELVKSYANINNNNSRVIPGKLKTTD